MEEIEANLWSMSLGSEKEKQKWVKYYSSSHRILLVGEGDFSFSLCLGNAFGSATNMVSTSLDTQETVLKSYSKATSNLENLKKLGAMLLHGLDATRMKLHTDLKMRKFDRIIFNFPHAGFHGKEDQMHVIKLHRNLVQRFLENASHMLRPDGEIHVSHKTTAPFTKWNIEEIASTHSLALIECADFKIEDYPGYNNKRGAGKRADEPFPLGECCTFKFVIADTLKKKNTSKREKNSYLDGRSLEDIAQRQHPYSVTLSKNDSLTVGYPQSHHTIDMADRNNGERLRIFEAYFRHARETFGRLDYDYGRTVQELLRVAYENYMNERPGRDAYGYRRCLQELLQLSILRLAWLQGMLHGSTS